MKQKEGDFDRLVAFHTPFPFEGDGFGRRLCNPDANGNALVIRHLADMGIGSVFVQKGDYHENVEEDRPYAWGRVALSTGSFVRLRPADEYLLGGGGITAVRARARTPAWLAGNVPVINSSSIQAIGSSKWQQYQLFEPYMARTTMVEAGEPITPEAHNVFRRGFYLKADNGRRAEQTLGFVGAPAAEELESVRNSWAISPGSCSRRLTEASLLMA